MRIFSLIRKVINKVEAEDTGTGGITVYKVLEKNTGRERTRKQVVRKPLALRWI